MRDLYGDDDYESVAVGDANRLIPDRARKLAGAAVFLGLVAALGLWSFRLGTRDATEVPIIKAMEGPSRVEPKDPGGLQAAHQGLEVNTVLAGKPAPMPREAAATPPPASLAEEDAPQGELVVSAPAALAERVVAEGGQLAGDEDLPMPLQEATGAAEDTTEDGAPVLGETPATAVAALAAGAAAAAGPRPMNRPANLVVARPKKTEATASATPAKKPATTETAAAKKPAVIEKAAEKTPTPKPAATTKVASAAPAREVSGVRSGTRLVQLGAFDSEEITRRAWSQLVAKNPDLLSNKSLFVERTTANARVFYRLRVAGFDSSDQTRQMCESLRARGVACIPVTLQ